MKEGVDTLLWLVHVIIIRAETNMYLYQMLLVFIKYDSTHLIVGMVSEFMCLQK